MKDLSDRQKQIFQFIKRTVQDKGYPPSVREIGNAVGLQSSSTVHGHMAKLEDKGYIKRDPTKPRAIEIVQVENQSHTPVIQVPVLGKVTAGLPITAVENVDEYFPLPEHFTANHNSEIFLLNVEGDSMMDAGIFDGDLLIIDKSLEPREGAIAVCFIDGEFTLKRIHFEKHEGQVTAIWLQPENEQFTPIKVTQDNQFIIWGIVVHSVRSF